MFDLAGNTNKYNISADSFTIKWYSNPECTTEVTNLTADGDATYYLKVSYNAGEPSTESNENTDGKIAGDADHIVDAVNEQASTKLYGVYTINVISGEIQITKNWKVHWTLIVHSTSVLKTSLEKKSRRFQLRFLQIPMKPHMLVMN